MNPEYGVRTLEVTSDEAGARLDRWFKRRIPGLTHGRLEKLLRTGQVRVDGGRAKAGQRLEAGQRVRVPPLPDVKSLPPSPCPALGAADTADLRARVLYRDDDVLVVNKPVGLAVQGGSRTVRHLDAMLAALQFDADEPPRLVHRLDKDTSGALVLARNLRAATVLTRAFRDRDVRKVYWALTVGVPKPEKGAVDLPLQKVAHRGGRERVTASATGAEAVTEYEVLARLHRKAAWVMLAPRTGRTHQLRVHMALIGTPIAGDRKYGGAEAMLGGVAPRLHLHAREVDFPTPGGRRVHAEAPLPLHMADAWRLFGFDEGP